MGFLLCSILINLTHAFKY
ncbi:unnamed protein product [Spirodela intermedia]|uniref:Uncharacterized protein n=2 Tax=Spirodela intermedia TaxID=51605 RepID=A0A7I8L639_SPIIN|nr:unnamed protein product [Spirodela intermedia]CAA6668406.1 unnamed protein product [Spirodela intermedia]CAA7405252.1 unnamed protein product [Spirodela intermedia]